MEQTHQPRVISLRYACAPNGDQVGLSHYLMADAQKDREAHGR